MRWRRRKPQTEGKAAREKAERALEEVRARRPEVHGLASFLRVELERNHFRERIEQAWGGRP